MRRERPHGQKERVGAASLVGVFVLAKALGLAGRSLPLSVWTVPALLWPDLAVGLVCWLCFRWFGWSPFVRVLYWAVVAWVALNVPVVRALSSPLTFPMLRAAGGPLADSISHYATVANVACVALVLAAGWILPRIQVSTRVRRTAIPVALALAIAGPFAETSVDTRGAQQNAITALIGTLHRSLPATTAERPGDWRSSPFGGSASDDLSWLKGAAAGRNVVLIALESTGAGYLKTYGAPDDPMPALTRLSGSAVQFESAYAVYPESIKGLFALLCSRHPAFDTPVEAHAAAPCEPLARVLADAGYQTGLFHAGRFSYLGMAPVVEAQAFQTSEDAADIGGVVESSFGVDEPSVVRRILSWVDARDERRPFLVAYLPAAGHHPYAVPDPGPFTGEGDLSAYKNALNYADASMDALLQGLRSRGLDEKTLVVVFGDHGEAFGQHDGNFGHTLFAFDENVRVPLVISVPGVTTTPVRAKQVASVVDIVPTILDLLGMSIPRTYEGSSLLPDQSRMAYVFTDYALGWVGLRDGCWKYLLQIDSRRSQLYDVCVDPGEKINRAQEQQARVEAYRERTLAWIVAQRRRLRP